MTWEPILKGELEKEIENQFSVFGSEELSFFNSIKIPFEVYQIDREGTLEHVFVIAKYKNMVMFYEDVEEGFEMTIPDKDGVISSYYSNQFELKHVINQLISSNSESDH